MNVPLVNLRRNFQRHQADYNRILTETAASCQFVMGDAMRRFEEHFAAYLGVRHVLGVGSGTDALTLLLKAHNVRGKRVLTQNNTFIATALAIANAGGIITLCDTDPDNSQIAPESYTGEEVAAVLPVHLYGYPMDVEKLRRRFGNVPVFEDACQAHGSSLQGRRCGSFGKAAAFSFYPGKNLGAFGDGGAVATDDDALAEEIRSLRNWGGKVKYIHDREGGNSRLDTLQAAILDYKLGYLDQWNAIRHERAAQYRRNLADCADLTLPAPDPEGGVQNYHLFVVRLAPQFNRDEVVAELNRRGIGAGIHYPLPVNRQKVYEKYDFARMSFPVSEEAARRILSLPLCPEITPEEVDFVSENLRSVLAEQAR